jgi:hypothetical protein
MLARRAKCSGGLPHSDAAAGGASTTKIADKDVASLAIPMELHKKSKENTISEKYFRI